MWVLIGGVAPAVAGFGLFCLSNHLILRNTRGKIYERPGDCPKRQIGIVFGCAKHVSHGGPNLHYQYRVEAAAALYREGKVALLLVSGDNHAVGYDEPTNMMRDLVKLGVPEDSITRDYAGFSTLDTVVRAKRIFGVEEAILITQNYHLPRALYVARRKGLDAIGFAAREPSLRNSILTKTREVVARTATFGDVNLWWRQPRFLGPKEPIVLGAKVD